jgi:hypothetical protein
VACPGVYGRGNAPAVRTAAIGLSPHRVSSATVAGRGRSSCSWSSSPLTLTRLCSLRWMDAQDAQHRSPRTPRIDTHDATAHAWGVLCCAMLCCQPASTHASQQCVPALTAAWSRCALASDPAAAPTRTGCPTAQRCARRRARARRSLCVLAALDCCCCCCCWCCCVLSWLLPCLLLAAMAPPPCASACVACVAESHRRRCARSACAATVPACCQVVRQGAAA